MKYFFMFDNNIYAFLLLTILLIIVVVKKDIYDYSRKLFYRMIVVNMILLLVEVLAWAFDGINTESAFFFNYLFNVLLILFEPIMASMWLSYVDYKINNSVKRLKRRFYYLYASLFAGILLVINFFSPVAFYIDDDNIYHRGGFLWLSLLFVFLLVSYTIVLAIKNRKLISSKLLLFVTIFAFLPILVSFIQLFVYGLILTWAVVALGVVFAYYIIEIAGNSVDYLTKLLSRRKMEEIVRGKIEGNKVFTLIMIDLEYFKEINDKYGHQIGDELLVHFAFILKKVFGKNNFVSRIGGDEFMILVNGAVKDLNIYKDKIYSEIQIYENQDSIKEINFSYGGRHYDSSEEISYDSVYDDVDKLMYENKSKNKNRQRRKSDIEN